MAGGIWSSQNKVRPGAYINFEFEKDTPINIGERGIVALPMELSWGGEDTIIELTSEDLANGNSLAKVGLLYTDSEALLINLALQNARILKLYNLNSSGVKASKTLASTDVYNLTTDVAIDSSKTYYTRSGSGTSESPYVYTAVAEPVVADIGTYYEKTTYDGLTITAKYPGTFGNKIAILITQNAGKYVVETYANGYLVDTQKVEVASELISNNYVDFTTTNAMLNVTSSTLLTGGTNGSPTALSNFFNKLLAVRFNTVAIPSTSTSDITTAVTFVRNMRNNEGKYIQAVVAENSNIDYEGVINVGSGVTLEDGTTITMNNFTAWVAGATAGAGITDSLTGKIVPNAVSIPNMMTNDDIIVALNAGKFVLSLNQDGAVKVEKDINSLHTFTDEKNYTFSKNRVIRELDSIGENIKSIWENTYLGKVTNNEAGRTLFKSSIIDYLTSLQNVGAIDEFNPDNVIVEAGEDTDSVLASIAVKPLDSMELLYMTINVQ